MVFGLFDKKPAEPVEQHLTQRIGKQMDFSRVTTREIAEQGVQRGFLERFLIVAETFGGVVDEGNMLYGPVGVGAAKAALDDEITAALLAGQPMDFHADMKYDAGQSIVPRAVTFHLGPMGTRTFVFW